MLEQWDFWVVHAADFATSQWYIMSKCPEAAMVVSLIMSEAEMWKMSSPESYYYYYWYVHSEAISYSVW